MPGTREPVVLILDPDAVYGADLIDYYFVEHGLRSVLGFTEKNARRMAFADVPQAHSRAAITNTGGNITPGPNTPPPQPAAPDQGQPAWAKAMKDRQTIAHGATIAAHTLKSGDSHGGGASIDTSEKD